MILPWNKQKTKTKTQLWSLSARLLDDFPIILRIRLSTISIHILQDTSWKKIFTKSFLTSFWKMWKQTIGSICQIPEIIHNLLSWHITNFQSAGTLGLFYLWYFSLPHCSSAINASLLNIRKLGRDHFPNSCLHWGFVYYLQIMAKKIYHAFKKIS